MIYHKVPRMKFLGTFFFVTFFIFNAQAKLSETRGWQKLLHIERGALGIKSSQVSDTLFFLANQKNWSAESELQATLIAFNEPLSKYEKTIEHPLQKNIQIVDHSQHPICRFPARYSFLKKHLPAEHKNWNELPQPNCIYQKIFLNALDAQSVSFVFSSYYSDSPGSAFGHTLFRINRKSATQSSNHQELLDYGVGYAANVTVSNPALYALMGLVGGFQGTWTNLPYYYKVREYNDFEARDLWSYDLNLTADEVELLTFHLWEVGAHYYTYYFFTQNCAYHMLTLLEAAAPRLHISDKVPFYYVVPADSMKALFYEADLVRGISYRPSIRNTFLKRYELLSPKSKELFKEYVKTDQAPTGLLAESNQDQAAFWDTSMDLFDLKYPKNQFEAESKSKKKTILQQRVLIDHISPDLKIDIDEMNQPQNSHGSSRFHFALGESKSSKIYELNYRFALHDLLDPQYGLPENSQLEFFNLKFKKIDDDNFQLSEFYLFRVFNLNPWNFFEKKASWGLEIGSLEKSLCHNNKICMLNGLKAKYGASTSADFLNLNNIVWLMPTLEIRHNTALPHGQFLTNPGLEVGLLLRWNEYVHSVFKYEWNDPINFAQSEQFELEARYNFNKSFSLGLKKTEQAQSINGFYYY